MKIIFLDIDGVLNSRKSAAFYREPMRLAMDPKCVEELNTIWSRFTNTLIVLSSTWRLHWPLPALQKHMMQFGFKGHLDDRTSFLNGKERGIEILDYLNRCRENDLVIDSFVILDDDSDMGALRSRLVQTSDEVGLTHEGALEAIELLNSSW
jgi:hypothetical protein